MRAGTCDIRAGATTWRLAGVLACAGVLGAAAARAGAPPGNVPGGGPPGAGAGAGAEPGAEELEEFTDDLIILKSGLGLEGKVVGESPTSVRVQVEYGVLMIPRAAIERIEFNLLSRLNQLAEDDYAGRYRLAMRAVEMGMTGPAKGVLEGLVGKEGVPPAIFKALAEIYDLEGELEKALACWKKYLMSNPGDADAKARIAEIEKELGAGGVQVGEAGGGAGGGAAGGGVPEGLEAGGGWNVLNWGNPSTAREHSLDGNRVLMVQVAAGGKQDKAAIGKGANLDFSGKSKLRFHAFNGEKQRADVAVAIITSADYFESRPVGIKPDWNMDVSIDIQSKDWKSKATDWTFKTGIEGLDSVKQIILLIYTGKREALVYFDFMRAE